MIKPNQIVVMKWNGRNKRHFESKGYQYTKQGDEFEVVVNDLMETSQVKIVVICDLCNINEYEISYYAHTKSQSKKHICKNCNSTKSIIIVNCWSCDEEFQSTLMALKKSKSGNLFCSNMCVGTYNSEMKNDDVEKICEICDRVYFVRPAYSEKSVTCSRSCQNEWQSVALVGENANNYKGGNREKRCEQCHIIYNAGTPSNYKASRFCSIECKQEHWKQHTLTSETFINNRAKGTVEYRRKHSSKKTETLPEKMTREFFESLELHKGRDFLQEVGILNRYVADFYFPSQRLVVEVYGDYWHANPSVYGDGKILLNDYQISAIRKDQTRKSKLQTAGYTYLIIWEKDIYEDVEQAVTKALSKKSLTLYPLNDCTQDIQTV